MATIIPFQPKQMYLLGVFKSSIKTMRDTGDERYFRAIDKHKNLYKEVLKEIVDKAA